MDVTTSQPGGTDPSVPVGHRVVVAVADAVGVAPADLDPPLYEVTDPDALEALFRGPTADPDGRDCHVEFEYAGCRVVVDGADSVVVSRLDGSSSSRRA